MSDLISRKAAIKMLEEQLDYLCMLNSEENPHAESKWYGVNWARNAIADMPSSEPERKTGKWIDMGDYWKCSECEATQLKKIPTVYGDITLEESKYCPYCGAKMGKDV